jgi:Ser/Thr protein kinase RdoA (MazF antagonist)
MDTLIALYQQRLGLQAAHFSRINHEDAMVDIVYKVSLPKKQFILKICGRNEDFLREAFFLKHFEGLIPVPQIVELVPPENELNGAILMECLPGRLLQPEDYSEKVAFELGVLLASIHIHRTPGYGDLIDPVHLSPNPLAPFTKKFEEGLAECENHLPKELLEQCRSYFEKNSHRIKEVDGPCMIHRDFRPGNILVNEGKVQGIIDWSSARASFAEDDFCPIEHGEWPANSVTKKSFFDGYASMRPIPDYNSIMPLLRINRALAVLGFTVKRGTWNGSNALVYQKNRQFLETFF